MPLNNTKKNHYVPKFYLKNFTDEKGNIYFFDKSKKMFHNTKNLKIIAFKENLYTITNKISQADIKLFCKLFDVPMDIDSKIFFIDALKCFFNDEFSKLFRIKHQNKDIEKELNKIFGDLLNETISRNQELLFSLYEDDFIPSLTYIVENKEMISIQENKDGIFAYLFKKIISFIFEKMQQKMLEISPDIKNEIEPIKTVPIYSKNQYYDLLHYVLIQCFRTNKIINVDGMLEATRSPLFKVGNIYPNAHNVMFLFIHYQTLNMADKLIQRNYKIVLLKNCTEKNFFTSDNPSINTHAEIIQDFGPKDIGCEIFFPLSPKLALLLTNTPTMFQNYNKQKSEIIIDKEEQIDYWNNLIFNNAERYMYGSSQEELESFIDKACKYYRKNT